MAGSRERGRVPRIPVTVRMRSFWQGGRGGPLMLLLYAAPASTLSTAALCTSSAYPPLAAGGAKGDSGTRENAEAFRASGLSPGPEFGEGDDGRKVATTGCDRVESFSLRLPAALFAAGCSTAPLVRGWQEAKPAVEGWSRLEEGGSVMSGTPAARGDAVLKHAPML